MPRQDKTGPLGQGPLTGRGLGPCNGGRSRGSGMGRGFGWRARSMQIMPIQQPTVITKKQEKQFLEQNLNALKEEIKETEERLKEFKK